MVKRRLLCSTTVHENGLSPTVIPVCVTAPVSLSKVLLDKTLPANIHPLSATTFRDPETGHSLREQFDPSMNHALSRSFSEQSATPMTER